MDVTLRNSEKDDENRLFYSQVKRVLCDKKRENLLVIVYTETDDQNREREEQLTIHTQDRDSLLDSLTCYWQIDHMVTHRTFKTLPLIVERNLQIKIDDRMGF